MSAYDLYVWESPRDLDADRAAAMLSEWETSGGDPAESPFGPSSDVGWLVRELVAEAPRLDVVSDATPRSGGRPIWLETDPEPPARLVAVRVRADTSPEDLGVLLSLAAKYDLVVFDARNHRLHSPLAEMAAHASATFWPRGAIQAAVAGALGGLVAVVAWMVALPIVSGILVLIGGFMVVMAIYTFVHEGRAALRARGG